MPRLRRPAGDIGQLLLSLGELRVDRHQRHGEVGPASIELDAALGEDVLGLQHHLRLHQRRIVDAAHHREEFGHKLMHRGTHAGAIDGDFRHPIFAAQLLDLQGLPLEIEAAPLEFFEDAELALGANRRRDDDAARIVAILALRRVIADPDFALRIGPQVERVEVFPDVPAIDHARAQHAHGKAGRAVIYKGAQEQVVELIDRIFPRQFVPVDPVKPARDGVIQRDDVAPDIISAQHAARQRVMAGIDADTVFLGPALIEPLARPHRIGFVSNGRWRREIGFVEKFLRGDGRRDLVDRLETVDPETLIDIDVAAVSLRGAVIGAKEIEGERLRLLALVILPAPVDDHGVTLERLAQHLEHEVHDVLAENVRLRAARGNEDLVVASLQPVNESFAGKIEGRADLAALEQEAGPVGQIGPPCFLMTVQPVEERALELGKILTGDEVVGGAILLLAAVPVCDVGIEVAFMPAGFFITPHARGALDQPPQQVDFLEILARLLLFPDELVEAHVHIVFDTADDGIIVPFVAILPRLHRGPSEAHHFRNLRHAPAAPIIAAGDAARVVWNGGGWVGHDRPTLAQSSGVCRTPDL